MRESLAGAHDQMTSMSLHRLLWIAAAMATAACAPGPTSASAGDMKATDFETAIGRLEASDPQSPEALNARLDYADFLSEPAASGCQQRLAAAQAQLDAVAARPAPNILLPMAPARMAGDEYKIHLARATCAGNPPLKDELQQALAAAQQAVPLYRDALNNASAVVMQFNVAALYRELGDTDNAISALQSAIAMDRDYGFRDDAEDDTRLLLAWQGKSATDSDVAALMKDFPARTAEFKFHWSNIDADVAVTVEDTSMIHGNIVRSRGSVALQRHIRASAAGWTVSSEPGESIYALGDWPAGTAKSQWTAMYFMARALLQAPAIDIGKDGDFKSVGTAEAFGTNLAAAVAAKIGIISSGSDAEPADATLRDLKAAFSADFIESRAMQDYGMETGTWIGAKLEQGVWYQMSTQLFLPGLGLGHYLIDHDVSFAFTRQVPCTSDPSAHLCAEIVMHAIPIANDLKSALQDLSQQLKFSNRQALHHVSVTDIRLVIDPDTLLTYVCDTRQYWYSTLVGSPQKGDPIIESIRTVSTSVYH
jgi:tetratricopeptide (TPR) repeat protein